MELKFMSFLGTVIVLLHVSEARPHLIDFPEVDDDQDEIMAADKQHSNMDPIDLLASKDLLLYNMKELDEEGKENKEHLVPKSATTAEDRVKRRSLYKTLCKFRSATDMSFVPCWKYGRQTS